ncbi:MAG: elongation factor G [Proteobacteria bacterium]|nr:elongation factor G [Pseudomonadota bacterium]MDA1058689.1 elongation factor G [Pseudomonadota bacterium]
MANSAGPRSVALVGPYMSGKTTLLESILFATKKISRKGTTGEGSTVGDHSQEARDRSMGTEVNVATASYLGDSFSFLDCPGSIEFAQETYNALIGVDAAVIVADADPAKALALSGLLHFLEEHRIPRLLFINKVDKMEGTVDRVVNSIQATSQAPLVLREFPILEGENLRGYIDLPSGRAFTYADDGASTQTDVPAALRDEFAAARYAMLERLSDFDEALMERLLEEEAADNNQAYASLRTAFQEGHIVPTIFGAAEHDAGVWRLLKMLRHEVASPDVAAARIGATTTKPVAQILKTFQTPNFGKMSVARVWSGTFKDGDSANGERIASLFHMVGQHTEKVSVAGPGEIVAFGRLDEAKTGDTLTATGTAPALPRVAATPPVFAMTIAPAKRDDDVKLSGSLAKILDEDPSLQLEHNQETGETILRGQGEIHLRVATEKMKNRFKIEIETGRPRVPYKEAIRKPVSQHARFKRQSGGHGQFGDVHIDIKPLPRGSGFQFEDKVVGGSVPRQYIPAVEAGVREYLTRGPLGFNVVDLCVTLNDGQYHSVDSSEMAFKTAGSMAMKEGMPKCDPVLLEPILAVNVTVPSEVTPKVNAMASARRGQILGFDTREGWSGWDVVKVNLPQSEIHDLIIELRSVSQGVGSYTWAFDHLQEIRGRLADEAVQTYRAGMADAAQ